MASESDSYLLEQLIRAHDAMAFDEIARRYRGMVFSTARRVTQSHHDAEDVAQNCFLELARKAHSIRTSLPAFLHATATRRSIDILRDQHRRRKHEKIAAAERVEPIAADPSDRPWDEISPEVDRAIDRLPVELKTPIILYFLRGLSTPDIAMELDLSKGVVERRLQVGIRRLRGDLSDGNRLVSAGVVAVGLKSGIGNPVPASLTAATGRMALFAGSTAPRTVIRSQGRRFVPRWVVATAAVTALAAICTSARISFFGNPGYSAPYDQMLRLYRPYLSNESSSGFPWHIATMRTDASSFWRGSQPLFYSWCGKNCKDWLGDPADLLLCSGSPNLEDADRLPAAANSDNSAHLPIQLELLQGMIAIRLASDHDLGNSGDAAKVARVLTQVYRDVLQGDSPLASHGTPRPESNRFVDPVGRFRPIVLNHQGRVAEFLRPTSIPIPRLQSILADAMHRCPRLSSIFGEHPAVHDACERIRQDSVVTQGQLELLVQIEGTPLLLELKQQTPSPAELAGIIARDARPPGCRAAEDAVQLTGGALSIGWCEANGFSFTANILTPEESVYELRKDRWVDPIEAARSWARSTASTHRWVPDRAKLASYLNTDLEGQLVIRSAGYLAQMRSDFQKFRPDPRVIRDRAADDAAAQQWLNESHLSLANADENGLPQ